jgi:hypothetical protein
MTCFTPIKEMVYWIDANRRIAALEAENALLRVAAGPLVVAALETAAKPEPRECCAFCGAAPRNPCDYAYPHPQAKTGDEHGR